MGSGEKSSHGLLGPQNTEALKQSFMAQLKEADFLRWGSTKRVTGLRKAEQDGIWDALRDRMVFFLSCHVFILIYRQIALRISGNWHQE